MWSERATFDKQDGMAGTGVVIDRRYLDHDTGRGHPERRERVAVLLDLLAQQEGLESIPPRPASGEELALVHDGAYVEQVEATKEIPRYSFDADTLTSPQSYETARLAAGGFLALLDAIMAGSVRNGFAFVRPPGHHAERTRAMGFCLFNNVAVGAEYLRRKHGLSRILVMDWDLHHGNGTQHMFERDPGVLYVSTHQYPYYPGTGALEEVGQGDGEGYTINLPFPAGFGDAEFAEAFTMVVEPIAHQFEPEFVLISAGFDAHLRDPLGGLQATEAGFDLMSRSLLRIAEQHAGGRCAAILEGGYDLTAIRNSADTVLGRLRTPAGEVPSAPASRATPLLERVRRVHDGHWKW
jgi:acetoin utilization deacetylase AcuC-like enzyme